MRFDESRLDSAKGVLSIGVFDSGIGGLTIVKEIRAHLRNVEIHYLADELVSPYGEKDDSTVQNRSLRALHFLIQQQVDVIVIACNTAVAALSQRIAAQSTTCMGNENEDSPFERKNFEGVPVVDIVNLTAKYVFDFYFGKKIGVLATTLTTMSGVYQNAFACRGLNPPIVQACPLLVPYIERGQIRGSGIYEIVAMYLEELLSRDVTTIILGCTHYPLLMEVIQDITDGRVPIITNAVSVVHNIESCYRENFQYRENTAEKMHESDAYSLVEGGRAALAKDTLERAEMFYYTTANVEDFEFKIRRFPASAFGDSRNYVHIRKVIL